MLTCVTKENLGEVVGNVRWKNDVACRIKIIGSLPMARRH